MEALKNLRKKGKRCLGKTRAIDRYTGGWIALPCRLLLRIEAGLCSILDGFDIEMTTEFDFISSRGFHGASRELSNGRISSGFTVLPPLPPMGFNPSQMWDFHNDVVGSTDTELTEKVNFHIIFVKNNPTTRNIPLIFLICG